jgi:phosphatidylglycerophosphatase A
MNQRFADQPVLRFAWIVATWFGCGMVPKAPGTMGSFGAIPLYLLVARGGRVGVAAGALAVTAIGIWAASVVAHDLGKKDPQIVVVDEVAGMLVTMLPMADVSWRAILCGFLLFRLFDITKPWPTRRFEALPGGWGIVMDDVVAGGFGACLMVGLRAAGVLP